MSDRPVVLPQVHYEDPPIGGAVMVSGLSVPLKERMRLRFPDEFTDAAGAWPNLTYSITILIPDVDSHFEQSRGMGARTVTKPRDQPWGLRDYEVLDLEGRQWNFSQHLTDTKPTDWGATASP